MKIGMKLALNIDLQTADMMGAYQWTSDPLICAETEDSVHRKYNFASSTLGFGAEMP